MAECSDPNRSEAGGCAVGSVVVTWTGTGEAQKLISAHAQFEDGLNKSNCDKHRKDFARGQSVTVDRMGLDYICHQA